MGGIDLTVAIPSKHRINKSEGIYFIWQLEQTPYPASFISVLTSVGFQNLLGHYFFP